MKSPIDAKATIDSVRNFGKSLIKDRLIAADKLQEIAVSRELFLLSLKKFKKRLSSLKLDITDLKHQSLKVEKKIDSAKAKIDRLSVPAFKGDQRLQDIEKSLQEIKLILAEQSQSIELLLNQQLPQTKEVSIPQEEK